MRDEAERGQVSGSAAEVYEQFFVPALFAQWGPRIVDVAAVRAGERVLDVACGTGVAARAALERVGRAGAVVGLDVNEQMLEVAQRGGGSIEWRAGRAEDLPFADATFDAVLCLFGLMFFEDRARALQEMARVVRPGGRVAVAVWASLDAIPGYAAVAALLRRLFGARAAAALESPFALGDASLLREVIAAAGLEADLATLEGTARFASLDEWMFTEIRGWTLADALDDEQYDLLLQEARSDLAPFVRDSGAVEFPVYAHVATLRA